MNHGARDGAWVLAKAASGSQGVTRDGSGTSSLSHEGALRFLLFPEVATAGASV